MRLYNKKLSALRLWLLAIVLGLSMLIGIALYYNSLLIHLQDSACQTLKEVMQQEKNSFSRRLMDDSTTLEGYAALFRRFEGDIVI